MACNCPEIRTQEGWLPFCEGMSDNEAARTVADPGREETLPRAWRCPRCRGPIVCMASGRADPEGVFDPAGEDFRADFACRSVRCGWRDWVLAPACIWSGA
jgi:hypothetical protein